MEQKPAPRKKFVAVIGYPRSGKSTIIQSLSGCKNHSFVGPIIDYSVNLSIFVHAPSPQERPRTTETQFLEIISEVKADRTCQGLLIAIQPTAARRRLRMTKMFSIAKRAGFQSYAFVLELPFDERGRPDKRIGNFNNIKEQVQESDPGVIVISLDGRRFASLNSEVIRSIARFPY